MEQLIKEKFNKHDEEFLLDLSNFCRIYINDVVNTVVKKLPYILENKMILDFLHELRVREEQENLDVQRNIKFKIDEFLEYGYIKNDFDIHIHSTSHANSYRDILYDLLIRE